MKDSKVRVNLSTAGKKRAIDPKDVLREENPQSYQVPSEGSAAPVLKWDFPGELEKKPDQLKNIVMNRNRIKRI